MPKPLDFETLISRLRTLLIARGAVQAGDLVTAMNISQPTFSRLVEKMGPDLLIIGKARKTQYALRRAVPIVGTQAPLYAVNESGRPLRLGKFHFVQPSGCLLEPNHNDITEAIYSDIPYFLEDMRPSGFLGRLVPRTHPELAAPLDILTWTFDDCLRYWTLWGSNPIGNLIVGEKAIQKFLELHQRPVQDSAPAILPEDFPAQAMQILTQGEAGSSAGGEQPKFVLDATNTESAAIVKFSPSTEDPIGRRVADLLVCENICHRLLSEQGIQAANSTLHEVQNQFFLRVHRFDRVGTLGRRGLISLKSLSLEYVGTLDSWSKISYGLYQARKIDLNTHIRIRELELFGELIGNSDMHAGNFSFYLNERLQLGGPAPVYDMLPMMYYPRQNQIVDKPYQPRLPIPEEASLWKKAAAIALEFWNRAATDLRISSPFRETANSNRDKLKAQMELASDLF